MGNKNTARFDSGKGHPWDVVMDKADELAEMLHKDGFSSQDIAHIGLRLTHLGNFMWFVIKVDNQEDVGIDEKERYFVQGDKFEMEDILKSINLVDIHCRCVKVHPATKE